jgi:hypothetical protein
MAENINFIDKNIWYKQFFLLINFHWMKEFDPNHTFLNAYLVAGLMYGHRTLYDSNFYLFLV